MRNLIALFFSIAFSALSTWAGTGDAAFKQTVAAYKIAAAFLSTMPLPPTPAHTEAL